MIFTYIKTYGTINTANLLINYDKSIVSSLTFITYQNNIFCDKNLHKKYADDIIILRKEVELEE